MVSLRKKKLSKVLTFFALSFCLALISVFTLLPTTMASSFDVWDGTTVSASLSGSGTEGDPYLIQSASDLAFLQSAGDTKFVYKLTADIDWNNNNWKKIDILSLNGNNHTIKGIKPQSFGMFNLFATAEHNSPYLTNLKVIFGKLDCTVTNVAGAGLVVDGVYTKYTTLDTVTINNVQVQSTDKITLNLKNPSSSGSSYVGIIIAGCSSSGNSVTISNCSVDVDFTVNAYADEDTSWNVYVGAIGAGITTGGKTNVRDCYSRGSVSIGNGSSIGKGINCYASGLMYNSNTPNLTRCYTTMNLSANTYETTDGDEIMNRVVKSCQGHAYEKCDGHCPGHETWVDNEGCTASGHYYCTNQHYYTGSSYATCTEEINVYYWTYKCPYCSFTTEEFTYRDGDDPFPTQYWYPSDHPNPDKAGNVPCDYVPYGKTPFHSYPVRTETEKKHDGDTVSKLLGQGCSEQTMDITFQVCPLEGQIVETSTCTRCGATNTATTCPGVSCPYWKDNGYYETTTHSNVSDCPTPTYHSDKGWYQDSSSLAIFGQRISNCDNQSSTYGNCGSSHTYFESYDPPQYDTITISTGYVNAISGVNDGSAFFCKDSTLTASNTLTAPTNYGRTLAQLKTRSTYDGWTDFDNYWIIDSTLNDGLPVQKSTISLGVTTAPVLVDENNSEITAKDANSWNQVKTTGDGYYMSQDIGSPTNETVTLGATYDDGKYQFVGWARRDGSNYTIKSNKTPYSFEMTNANEGNWFALFREVTYNLTTSLCVIKADGTEVTNETVLKQYVDLKTTINGTSYANAKLNVLDRLKFVYEYTNPDVDFFVFDHWRINGTQLTADNISTMLDDGEMNAGERYLYTVFNDNVIANCKDTGTLNVVAVFRPVQYKYIISNLNADKGSVAVSGDYTGETETTANGTLIIKNIDIYSTIPSVEATTDNAISGWFYYDSEGNAVDLFTFDQIYKKLSIPQTTLYEQIVTNRISIVDHSLYYYVSFTSVYNVKVITQVDFGTYNDYDEQCSAFVYNSNPAIRETDINVFEGQEITFNYVNMSAWGYDFLGFFDKTFSDGVTTYKKRPATGEIASDVVVYGVYMRQKVDFSVKVLDQSSDTIYDLADYNREVLNIGISGYNSQFIHAYEVVNQGTDDETWYFTNSMDEIQTINSYQRYNDYVNFALSLQNDMNKIYKVLGIKILSPDATAEQIIGASFTTSASGSNTVNMTMLVNGLASQCVYMVYTKLDMSVQLAVETIDPGKTAIDDPSEYRISLNDEILDGYRVQDIKYADKITLESKAKTGFKFYGWKLPDGTIIQKSAISIDELGNVTELTDEFEYNTLILSKFDYTLKGIYTALYSKIAYKITVDNLAGDNIFSIGGKSSINVIEQFYINQTASITSNINSSKNYFGLSAQNNGIADYFNTIQLDEALIGFADENNTIKLYQIYEDNYLLTINNTDKTHAQFSLKIGDTVTPYTSACYVTRNSTVEITVTVDPHYHFTITGIGAGSVTEDGANFTMTGNTTLTINVAIDSHKLEFVFDDGYGDGAVLTGAGTYAYGQTAHISADINPGYQFVMWTIDDGNGAQSKLTREFDYTITADTKCKIILKYRYTITTEVSDPAGATITPSFELNEKDRATITVTVNDGYTLKGWQIDGIETDLTGTTITITGEKTCTYTAVISQNKYYFNIDEITEVYGETGYTISAPQNGEYYIYNEQVEITLTTPTFLLRLNKFSANSEVLATNSSVSNECQLTVSMTAGEKAYFTGDTTVIHLDYTRIYALNIVKTETEAEDSVLNEMYYISKQTAGNTTTYYILDGTAINIYTKDNTKYIFNKYEQKVGDEYQTLSTNREILYTVSADGEIRVVYLGKMYDIDFVYHVLDESGIEMTNFNQNWISNRTYSFKDADNKETLEFRYGSKITITPAILPYGLTIDHFTFDGTSSTSSITVLMNKESNITVDVYYSRVAINLSVYNSESGVITKILGNEVDAGNAIYNVTGEGSYYIGDSVTIKLGEIQAYKSYFQNKGWTIGGNKLNFNNRVATFNGNTYRVENNNLTLRFTLIPFSSDTNVVLTPDLVYTEFSINVAIYLNRSLYNPTDVPMATATILVNGVDTASTATKVHFKDKVELVVTYNPTGSQDYVNVYKFEEITCGGYPVKDVANVIIGDDQSVTYTINEFVSAKKGNYRFKYASSKSSFTLTASPEKAVQDSALYQDKAEYAQGDSVTIRVDQNKINAGYRFLGWYYNDELKSSNLEYKFDYNVSLFGNTFEARFEALDYTFEFLSAVNGRVTNANDEDLVGTKTYNAYNGFTDVTDQNTKQIIFTPDFANGYCIDDIVYYASNDAENTHSVYDLLAIDENGVGVWEFDFALVSELISIDNIANTTFVIKATFKHIVLNVNVQIFCEDVATTQDDLIEYTISGFDGTNLKTFDIEYGESFVLTVNSLKDGYKLVTSGAVQFAGENQTIDSNSVTTLVKQNGILAIYIERIEYTINLGYVKDYGIVTRTGKAKVGETIIFTLNSVNTGYDFAGFYRGSRIDADQLLSSENRYEFTFAIEKDTSGNIITTYNYYAGFIPKSITFVVKAYDGNNNLIDVEVPLYYKVDSLTNRLLNNVSFKYGDILELTIGNIEGYTFSKFADNSIIQGTRVTVNDAMLKGEGEKTVILIYTANQHKITIYHNMYGATDKDGVSLNIAPAQTLRYSKSGGANYGFGFVRPEVSAEYNSTIRFTINAISSEWTFVGLREIKDDGTVTTILEGTNSNSYSFTYTVGNYDAEIVAYFSPKVDFKDFDDVNDKAYTYKYTSNPVSLGNAKIGISANSPLNDLMSITYNGSANAPTNAGEYTLALKFDSSRIPGLKDFVSPTATLKITPIELKFAYDGRISKVYDGTSSILVYSGLKIADGILQENDVDWLTLSTADANFSANFVRADKDVYYNRIDVGENYSVRFENLKLVSRVGDYSSKVNNYVFPDNSNTIIFHNIGSIVKRDIDLQNVLVVNKIFDDTTNIKFREGYSLANAVLNPSQKVKIGDLVDDVSLDFENIELSYSTKEVGNNVSVIFKLLNNSVGLVGAKANNYSLKFPTLTGYTIHPNQVTITGDFGEITIVDVDNNLYMPLDLQIKVTAIRETSESYASIYGIIEPQLANNKNFGIGYNIALYSKGFEYKIINGAVMVFITPPADMNNSRVENVYKLVTAQDNTSVENMTITTDVQKISFRTSELGTFVLVATRNPVPLWLIIVISVIVALAILFLCLYLFVIVPRKREKAYANFSRLEP